MILAVSLNVSLARGSVSGAYGTCKATNAFRAVHALSRESHTLLMPLGGEVGEEIADALTREGLPFERLSSKSEHRRIEVTENPATFEQTERKSPRVFRPEDLATLTAALPQHIRRGDIVIIAGSLPPGPSMRDWGAMFRAIADSGGRLLLDCAQFPALFRAGVFPWILKVNRDEWRAWEPKCDSLRQSLAEAGRALICGNDLHAVIVTDGAQGAIAVTADQLLKVAAPERRGWSLGCGDAFAGGLAVGLDESPSLDGCLRLATACALANLATPVPGEIPTETVQTHLAECDIQRVIT